MITLERKGPTTDPCGTQILTFLRYCKKCFYIYGKARALTTEKTQVSSFPFCSLSFVITFTNASEILVGSHC